MSSLLTKFVERFDSFLYIFNIISFSLDDGSMAN